MVLGVMKFNLIYIVVYETVSVADQESLDINWNSMEVPSQRRIARTLAMKSVFSLEAAMAGVQHRHLNSHKTQHKRQLQHQQVVSNT